jgi:hypothetical protein
MKRDFFKNNDTLRGNKSTISNYPKAASEHAGTKVLIKEYNPNTHKVRVVDLETGKPLEQDAEVIENVKQEKKFNHPDAKILKNSLDDNAPIVEVTNDIASMRGNKDMGFFTYKNGGGNIIKGPLSIMAKPENVRLSGINILNPLLTTGFASTIVTPIPTCLFSIPGAAAIKPILRDVTVMSTLLAATGSAGVVA